MKYYHGTCSLVRRAIIEARILKWYKIPRKNYPPPSKILKILLKPKNEIHLRLTREERKEFIDLIHEMYKTRKIILKYKKEYSRKPKILYKKVFGFSPRMYQSVKVFWSIFNIHFVFKKNDLVAFWKRVRWGPGTGGYYFVGDRDIKIQALRGLVSFGREEAYSIETKDTMRHESVHAFEHLIKKRKFPSGKKSTMLFRIKSELNACLPNFKYSKNIRKRKINKWARLGLGLIVKDEIEDYLSYNETLKRIRNIKSRIRRSRNKKTRKQLSKKLNKLKGRLEQKRRKKRLYFGLYRKNVNQIKKALEVIPVVVLQRIIYETPYERLYRKIPETVKIYKKIRYGYNSNKHKRK